MSAASKYTNIFIKISEYKQDFRYYNLVTVEMLLLSWPASRPTKPHLFCSFVCLSYVFKS